MKKMTTKEFKEVLSNAGIDFDTLGWEGVINEIIGSYRSCESDLNKVGFHSAAEHCRRVRDSLFDQLDERGYYDSLKSEVEKLEV